MKIKGREVIEVDFTWTLQELYDYMKENWDQVEYGEFVIDKPQPMSIEEYICLPGTAHTLIIAYPRKNKIIFSVADNPEGLKILAASAVPTNSSIARIFQSSLVISRVKEFKGPAAEICEIYANHMRELLGVK